MGPWTPRKKVPPDDPKKPTQVYSRKRNKTKALHSADPSSSDVPNLGTNYITLDDDLDLPIALRKSTHSCVSDTHQFKILYHITIYLLPFVLSFPHFHLSPYLHVSGALSHTKWKEAMIDEMQALEKNDT